MEIRGGRTKSAVVRWSVVGLLACLAGSAATAQLPPCVGDCDGNRVVTINELIRGVSIGLGSQPASSCPAFDRNEDAAVTINELIAGVNAALQGCFLPVTFRGVCLRPGPGGLVPCAQGSNVRLLLCLDRSRCLVDPGAVRLLHAATIGAGGAFALSSNDEALREALLLLETDVESGVRYRSLFFGPASDGGTVADLAVDPRSEAAARLLHAQGLNLFGDLSISDLIQLVRAALADVTFAGLGADAAVDLALTTAAQDTALQNAIAVRRFTPTPTVTQPVAATATATASVTHTPTLALTATASATATVTLTRTVTATPTASATASSTPTVTLTRTSSATPTATPTVTHTSTATASATVTRTPTATSEPTPTLPPLNVALEVNPDPVRPGETVEVSLTVTNTGGSPFTVTTASITLPQNIESFPDSIAPGTGRCGVNQLNTCMPGGTITWPFLGSIAPGEGVTVRVPPIVAAGTPNGTALQFSAVVETQNGLSAMPSYTATVQTGSTPAPFDLALTTDSDPVAAGSLLTYTATFGFRAPVGSAMTVVRIIPPAGTSFVEASDGGTPAGDGSVTWAVGALTPGGGGIRRLTVQVDDGLAAGRLLAAEATISRSDDSGLKRAHLVGRIAAGAGPRLLLAANPDPARPGDPLETALTVTNPGGAPATVQLQYVVPDHVDSFSHDTVTGLGSCGNFIPTCERRNVIRWSNAPVPAGDAVTFLLQPAVAAAAPRGAVIPIQARLTNVQGYFIGTARTAVRVDGNAPWNLVLEDDHDPAAPAEQLIWRLIAAQPPSASGPLDGILTLAVPDGAEVVDAGADAVVADGTVQWALGAVAPGAVARREVIVQIDPAAVSPRLLLPEAVVHTAGAAGAATRVRTVTRSLLSHPLGLAVALVRDPVRPGEALETLITLSNRSAATNFSGRVYLRLPEEIDAFSSALSGLSPNLASGLSCSNGPQCNPHALVTWTPFVPPGETASMRIPPLVSAGTPDGTLLRLHAVAHDLSNGRTAVHSRAIAVDAATPFDLAVSASQHPVPDGQPFTYTLEFGRPAPGPAADALLSMVMPPGVFVIGASDGGTVINDTAVEWDLGALAAGAAGVRTVEVVTDALVAGTPLRARATLSDGGDPATAKHADVATSVGTPPLELAVSATSAPPGGTSTVTVSVTNPSAATVPGVLLEANVPAEAAAFLDSVTTPMTPGERATCGGFGQCMPRGRVVWVIGPLAAGATFTGTFPAQLQGGLAPGTVVPLIARVQPNFTSGLPVQHASGALIVAAP